MPQAVAAAAVWVGNVVGSAVIGGATALGVGLSTALPIGIFAAKAAFEVSQFALLAGLLHVVDDIATQKAAPMGSELNLRVAADVPRELVIGERVLAGSVVARYSYGSNLYNASFVYQLADHPMEELSKVYGDGRLVRNTPLIHGARTEITAYSYSGGARVWMTWHDGRPGQTYDAGLVAKSAQDPDVVAGMIHPWTSAHVGAGCAYVHIEVQWDSDILTSIPEFKFLVKGARLYDRRKDTTAGGSGSQRLDDPSTWTYSTNAAVALDHYMLGYMVEGDPVAFGIGLSTIEVPYAQFAQAANLSDEDVTTGEGGGVSVMKRYEVHGVVSAADTFESVLTSMQNQMCARIVDLGGRIGIIGAEEQTATISLNDLDWASDEAVRFADKLDFSALYGAVIGSYADPGNLFEPTPYERQATPHLALPDGGEATTAQLDLPYETNSRRAVRLARAWIDRESLQPRVAGVLATRSRAWKLEPGDWFNLSSQRWQFTNEKFEVVDIVKHDDFTVTLTARAINPNFLAFPVDEDPDLSVPPSIPPADLRLEAPAGTLIAVNLSGGGATEPALRLTLSSIAPPTREYVVEICQWDGAAFIGAPWIVTGHSDELVNLIRAGVLPDRQYKARIKARSGERESAWTAWSAAVSTSATYLVPAASVGTSITGQGALATINGVYFGSSYLTETNGGSVATLGNFKTSSGTAAAIAGQGDLATTNRATLGFGVNGLVDSDFLRGTTFWNGYWPGNTGLGVTVVYNLGGYSGIRNVICAYVSGAPANGTVFECGESSGSNIGSSETFKRALRVSPGDRVYARALLGAHRCYASINVKYFNGSGVFVTEATGSMVTAQGGGGSGDPANFSLSEGYFTVPAGCYLVGLSFRGHCNGVGGGATPYVFATEPMLMRVPAGQTALAIPYAPGATDPLGDQTSGNTAGGIAGQGSQATANHYRGPTYPYTPTEGSWWADTSANWLKLYTGGAWNNVAPMTASTPPSPVGYSGQWLSLLSNGTWQQCIAQNITVVAGQKIRVTANCNAGVAETSTVTEVKWRVEANNIASGTPAFFSPSNAQFDNTTPILISGSGAGIFTANASGTMTIYLYAALARSTSTGNGKCYDPGGTIYVELL